MTKKDKNVKVLINSDKVTISEDLGNSPHFNLQVQNKHVPVQHGKFSTTLDSRKFSKVTVNKI